MAFAPNTPKPPSLLGYHRILSPTASVKVSPIAFGGISIGSAWSGLYGKNDDPFTLLDNFVSLGGNFIDTSNIYSNEESEMFIGEWMEKRGHRDQMVIATKYSSGYKSHDREEFPMQSNYTGNGAKSMHLSLRDSLKKLKTDYIDLFYVHWWDFGTSVEEVMTHLHKFVMSGKVLYLGISDTPAWIVVKANEYARKNGLTPFSVYQGRWNAAFRDMEAEIIPMCEDQGMAIVPWQAIGGGILLSAKQRQERKQKENEPGMRKRNVWTENDVKVSDALEKIATSKGTTVQAAALAYLFHQSPYVFPIVGVQTVEHVKAMPDALRIKLSREEIEAVQKAIPFRPPFPMDFLFGEEGYNTNFTAAVGKQYLAAAWIDAPPKPLPYEPHTDT